MKTPPTECPHCSETHTGAGHVWIVTQGRVTQPELDALVQTHHISRCRVFDGGSNRTVGAGPLTDRDRIHHEAAIASVFDALEGNGFSVGKGDPR